MAPALSPEGLEVRCAGCGETLEVDSGLTEFICPDCATPQSLPPELMPPPAGGARGACNASQLAVCLSAITGGTKPTPACCANLRAQQGCFCQYARDPTYGRYTTSPYARQTLATCGLAVPRC